jgi:hypothetical protein
MEIARNYRKNDFLRITGGSVITEKKKKFHHYKFGQDSDAKNRLSLSSLVLPEQIPLTPHTQKFKTVTYSAVAISGHLTLKNHIFIQVYVSKNINY